MKKSNFTRSARLLTPMILLITAGCAEQPINDRPQQLSAKERMRFERRAKYIQPSFKTPTDRIESPYARGENGNFETVWHRMISLYAFPEVDNYRIDRELDWLLSRPDYLARVQERAEPYIYSILEEIEAKNLPGELALLPVVESAFRPEANSSAQAAGLWQFIPSTGRLYGLKQNGWYDGRRDIFESTRAATDFLKELNETFYGDWFLALASYNAGKGTVGKAIERNRNNDMPTDYWSLPLPKETQDYVPRLLAVAKLFANADRYNVPLRPIPDKPVFEPVNIGSQIDLSKAAEMAHLSMDDFYKLNPAFKRSCTAPDGPHRLLIPVEQVDVFKERLAQMSENDRVDNWKRHKIQPGEDLEDIALLHNTTASAIRKLNNLGDNYVSPGDYVVLPPPQMARAEPEYRPARSFEPETVKKTLAPQPVAFQSKKPVTQKAVIAKYLAEHKAKAPETATQVASRDAAYTVKSGETLYSIGRKFSVKPSLLAQWNHFSVTTEVQTGQKLVIKRAAGTDVALATFSKDPFQSKDAKINYTVKKGDSLMQISRKFNVSVNDLRKWNASGTDMALRPGQVIKVKVDKNKRPAT